LTPGTKITDDEQNFFGKVSVLVLDSRIKVKPTRTSNGARKMNKWVRCGGFFCHCER
jgi:DNA replication initiation complex subunit (GINS family)